MNMFVVAALSVSLKFTGCVPHTNVHKPRQWWASPSSPQEINLAVHEKTLWTIAQSPLNKKTCQYLTLTQGYTSPRSQTTATSSAKLRPDTVHTETWTQLCGAFLQDVYLFVSCLQLVYLQCICFLKLQCPEFSQCPWKTALWRSL